MSNQELTAVTNTSLNEQPVYIWNIELVQKPDYSYTSFRAIATNGDIITEIRIATPDEVKQIALSLLEAADKWEMATDEN